MDLDRSLTKTVVKTQINHNLIVSLHDFMLHHSLLGSLLVLKVTLKKLLKTNTFLEASHRSNYQFAKNFQIEKLWRLLARIDQQ